MPDSISAKRSILVVEDDEDIRESVAILVEDAGHPVLMAAHGAEALDLLRTGPVPALVLLDLMMPVMNGWDVLLAMRTNDDWARIPVVVITANHECAPTGAQALLKKPFETTALLALVERYCGQPSPPGNDTDSAG